MIVQHLTIPCARRLSLFYSRRRFSSRGATTLMFPFLSDRWEPSRSGFGLTRDIEKTRRVAIEDHTRQKER